MVRRPSANFSFDWGRITGPICRRRKSPPIRLQNRGGRSRINTSRVDRNIPSLASCTVGQVAKAPNWPTAHLSRTHRVGCPTGHLLHWTFGDAVLRPPPLRTLDKRTLGQLSRTAVASHDDVRLPKCTNVHVTKWSRWVLSLSLPKLTGQGGRLRLPPWT